VPLVDGGRAVGALVIQRKLPRAFGQREVVLAASVAAPILFALERARSRERERLVEEGGYAPARIGRPREVSLTGRVLSPGRALGTLAVRRLGGAARREEPAERDGDAERARLGEALARASEEMANLEAWAAERAMLPSMTALLSPSRYVLDDARLRGFMLKQVKAGASAETAVERVIREYTRVLSGAGDPVLTARAHEVEALGLRVLGHLGAPCGPLRPGAVLCAARLTVCDAIELAARHGSGVLLSTSSDDAPGIAIALALGLPVIGGLHELFRWAADGDRALVDANSGRVTLNPSGVDVAHFRRGD
jgi:signal transduction protein with GAF and PtsI domain